MASCRLLDPVPEEGQNSDDGMSDSDNEPPLTQKPPSSTPTRGDRSPKATKSDKKSDGRQSRLMLSQKKTPRPQRKCSNSRK